ncbi:segregation and condensation protein A [Brevibacterium casei]|uniref:segregation and condensation protein A n=1 Tax=Brevibacterium casei TaxID=33889 RepID=UPI001EE8BDFC|nr:ScpA family protein [Brevibacterium casei]MCT1551136.1 segregation/condensation protein A [Brevibacterium casei]MCT1561028.1 segregation/condensation protein A [Brevibacterium casei]MCT2209344.1 segregation/condensation protein A [Brevibacterium casei]MDH5150106.1 ScpA family protein [Brevibacterium casei]
MHGFQVELENFSGPFDLLLGLISKRRLDITEIALAEVTDEFIAYTTQLSEKDGGSGSNLAEISEFLLVAATLLDLKTARLLPHEEGEEELDLELLEARDLLFARLLQYKAYKAVSGFLSEAMTAGSIRVPRSVGLEEEFQDVLPPLELSIGPGELASLFATVLQRDHTPPTVAVDHIHLPLVSVSEQRGHILGLLRSGDVDFQDLLDTSENTLVVVARFLALLELFKVGLCDFDQAEPLGPLVITRTETPEDGVDLRTEGAWSAEEDGDGAEAAAASAGETDDGTASARETNGDDTTEGQA